MRNHPFFLFLVTLMVAFSLMTTFLSGVENNLSLLDINQLLKQVEENVAENQYEQSVETLNQVLSIDPHNYTAHHYLILVYTHLQDYDQAFEHYTQARDLFVFDFNLYLDASKIFIHQEDYHKAIELLTTALHLNPSNAHLYSLLGYCYKEIEDYHNAASALEIAIRINPNHIGFYLDLSMVYSESGYKQKSVDLLQAAYQTLDSDYRLFYYLAYYLHQMDKDEQALEWIDRGNEELGNHPMLYLLAGDIYYSRHEFNRAMDNVLDAYQLSPQAPSILFSLARLYYILQDYEAALRVFQYLATFDDYHFIALNYIGMIYLFNENYDQAIHSFQSILESDEEAQTGYINLGWTYHLMGDNLTALNYFMECYRRNPKDPNTLSNLGLVHIYLQNYDLAFYFLQETIKSNEPGYGYLYMAALYSQMGDIDNAILLFKRALTELDSLSLYLDSDITQEPLFEPLLNHPQFSIIIMEFYSTR